MKKAMLFILLVTGGVSLLGINDAFQFDFTSRYMCSNVPTDSILIENMTQGGSMLLTYPDTSVVFVITDVFTPDNLPNIFSLTQNYPNPFSLETEFEVFLPEADILYLAVYTLSGKRLVDFSDALPRGVHTFSFIAGQHNHFVLTAKASVYSQQRVMIQLSGSGLQRPEINYLGMPATQVKDESAHDHTIDFNPGDHLRFTGYVTGYEGQPAHEVIEDAPETSQIYLFDIAGLPPEQPSAISGDTIVPYGQENISYSVEPWQGLSYTWTVPDDWEITSGQGGSAIEVMAGSQSGEIAVSAESNCGISPPRTLDVYVSFNLTLDALPLEGGLTEGEGSYLEGEEVQVTATANEGYAFTAWKDADDEVVSTEASFTYVMPSEHVTLTAHFELLDYVLTLATHPEDGGETTGEGEYNFGEEVQVTATANEGYAFIAWKDADDEVVSTEASFTYVMPSEHVTLTAHFELLDYVLTLATQPEEGGETTGEGVYHFGEDVQVTASAAEHYEFIAWTDMYDDTVSVLPSFTYSMPSEDMTLTANFELITYQLTIIQEPEGAGVVEGGGSYIEGVEVTLTASPDDVYLFYQWKDEDHELITRKDSLTITMPDHDVVVIAHFVDPEDGYIVDVDGNVYRTVTIGDQTWMAENLRTTHYAYGQPIEGFFTYDEPRLTEVYGLLYTWNAMMDGAEASSSNPSGVQGVCPTGWHLPSKAEWDQLADYLTSEYDEVTSENIGNTLKSCRQVNSPLGGDCDTEIHPRYDSHGTHYGTDDFGFTGNPGGLRTAETIHYIGSWASFWLTNSSILDFRQRVTLMHTSGSLLFGGNHMNAGLHVRCMLTDTDEPHAYILHLTTVPDYAGTTFGSGNYPANYPAEVSVEAIDGYYFVNWTNNAGDIVSEEASFTYEMPAEDHTLTANLEPVQDMYSLDLYLFPPAGGTLSGSGTYFVGEDINLGAVPADKYVFLHWKDENDTIISDEPEFVFTMPEGDTVLYAHFEYIIQFGDGVVDIDGNIYETVIIGNQEWMSENLRVTKYNDGSDIPVIIDSKSRRDSQEGAYAIFPHHQVDGIDSDEAMVDAYGKLYNWYAADDSRGLCPSGWRVPSDSDWAALLDYLNDHHAIPNENVEHGAGNKLNSCRQVNSPLGGDCDTEEHPRWNGPLWGNYTQDMFGFSALPAGQITQNQNFTDMGQTASFWTSSSYNVTRSWYYRTRRSHGDVFRHLNMNVAGLSVRCLRDLE